MTKFQPRERPIAASGPKQLRAASTNGGRLRSLKSSINLSTNTILNGDTIDLGTLPKGASFHSVRVITGVSLAAATLAVGVAGNTGKYRAAAVQTTPDVPTISSTAAAVAADPLTAAEKLIATIAAANLPTTNYELVIEVLYTYDN